MFIIKHPLSALDERGVKRLVLLFREIKPTIEMSGFLIA